MVDFDDLYRKHSEHMEDFWSRRGNALKFQKTIRVFGHLVIFDSNHERVLDSAVFAEDLYSTAYFSDETIWRVHITVPAESQAVPPPERLIDLVRYTGADDWLSIDLREWGNCFVDMKRGEAFAVLSASLAGQPELVCQVLINTILTNFITRHGYSMLHASALIKNEKILLLQAPHGTGKSTTALRLLSKGFRLLSDSMVYIGERDQDLWMGGFPIGRIKLRKDMLPLFPKLAAQSEAEAVRGETKYRVELKRVDPSMAASSMIRIRKVEYCLLERWGETGSTVGSLTEDELWREIMVNSLHYDTPELWEQNLRGIAAMVRRASLHRLRIGTAETGIIHAVNSLW